jgi:hypothetical protein
MNACVRVIVLGLACLCASQVVAQEKPRQGDDLDVTMQIIVDPNAKLPDEVVRHIPLPTPRSAPRVDPGAKAPSKPEPASKGSERAQESRELGREAAESAKERSREAAEQREDARNSNNDKDKDKDKDRPDRPRPTPPPRG